MATKSDFTPAEWELLGTAPLMGGAAIAHVTPGEREVQTALVVKGWHEAGATLTQNPLIQELVKDREPGWPAEAASSSDLAAEARVLCDRAVAVLERTAKLTDVQDYQAFVLRMANVIARATEEGGFLGFGKKDVSSAEHGVLRQLAAGLRFDG